MEINMTEKALELLKAKRFVDLKNLFVVLNGPDVALILEEMPEESLPVLFRILPKELASEAFVEMDFDSQEVLIRAFTDKELKEVLDELFVDDAVDLIEEMPAGVVKRILRNTDPETRRVINQILNYPEDSAGSIMTTEYVRLQKEMTVDQAFNRIRQTGADKETIYTCYVTDKERKLIGLVTVKDLLLAEDDDTKLEDMMLTNIISVTTQTDQEEVAHMFSKYNFLALPVVDGENRMVGIVTFDDAMDVMEDEATEDIELMGAMTPSEKPYPKSTPVDLFKNRFPWLTLLMVSSTFTGLIITSFEDALAAQVALTAFIPMLMGTGGNSGSQSSVTVIRSLSLGELKFKDIGTVLWKELRTAVMCGVALAAVCFVKIWLIDHLLFQNPDITVMVDLVVCLALALTVVIAKAVGCVLPMVAKALGADPAVMASPFITTIVDAVSLLVYFMFAKALLGV